MCPFRLMRPLACVVMLLIAGAVTSAEDDPVKADKEKLQGAWSVVSFETDGKPDDKVKNDKVTIAEETISVKTKGGNHDGTFTINPKAKLKTIDIRLNNDGYNIPGIYELDGDNLKICLPTTAGPQNRPKEFKAAAGSNCVLLVLKRDKK